MTTAELSVAQQVNGAEPVAPQRLILRDIAWDDYRTISRALTGRHVRLTYDRGTLELMTISHLHGNYSRLLGRMVGVLTEELGLPLHSIGDMTCDREDLERGTEPDEGFYITNEPLIRSKREIDLKVDPPPDLVLEIDVSRSSLRRLDIYAAMRVPEVWRFDGLKVRSYQLGKDGRYAETDRSQYFPALPLDQLVRFLELKNEMDENSLIKMFRQWVREQLAMNWQP
jgi:Uma2 family endonuclease